MTICHIRCLAAAATFYGRATLVHDGLMAAKYDKDLILCIDCGLISDIDFAIEIR